MRDERPPRARAGGRDELETPSPRDAGDEVAWNVARAEIIERIYDTAVDPLKYEAMVDVWVRTSKVGGVDAAGRVADAALDGRAGTLDRLLDEAGRWSPLVSTEAMVSEVRRNPAWVVARGGAIVAINEAALRLLNGARPRHIADLGYAPEDTGLLSSVVHEVLSARPGRNAVTMRIRRQGSERAEILRVSVARDDAGQRHALVVSSELTWPAGFDEELARVFELTEAEIRIVEALYLGQSAAEIAARRGTALATVRTQIRSVLQKVGAHSQADLVRAVVGLMDASMTAADEAPPARLLPGTLEGDAEGLEPIEFRRLDRPDGRGIDWYEFGDPTGRPVLYMHLDYGLVAWPRPAEAEARRRGLRVIVMVRPGYGRSDPVPRGVDHLEVCAGDYAALCGTLGLDRVAVLCLGADLRFAARLAALVPGLVSGIVGCAAQLPWSKPEHYARMDKWQRFVLANARYAPRALPFIVKAGMHLARRLGRDGFIRLVNAGSPADVALLEDPEVRRAIHRGSVVTLTDSFMADRGFTDEAISSERDWSDILSACPAPVHLLQGDTDPQAPLDVIREIAAGFPGVALEVVPDAGQFLFFKEWRLALDRVEPFLAPRRG